METIVRYGKRPNILDLVKKNVNLGMIRFKILPIPGCLIVMLA